MGSHFNSFEDWLNTNMQDGCLYFYSSAFKVINKIEYAPEDMFEHI